MLLALDAFFFAPGAPVNHGPAAPDGPPANAGGGKHGGKNAYESLPEEYWDVREKALRGQTTPVVEPVQPDTTAEDFIKSERDRQYNELMAEVNVLLKEQEDLHTYQQMHQQALSSLRKAKNTDEMEQIDSTIQKIEDAATALERQHKSRLARANSMRKELAIS